MLGGGFEVKKRAMRREQSVRVVDWRVAIRIGGKSSILAAEELGRGISSSYAKFERMAPPHPPSSDSARDEMNREGG